MSAQKYPRTPAPDVPPVAEARGMVVYKRHLPGKRPEFRCEVTISGTLHVVDWLDRFAFLVEWAALKRRHEDALLGWFGPNAK